MPISPKPDDLQAAVEAGVIDAAQAVKLRAMRASQPTRDFATPDGEPPLADEERFRFLNGFNDVFLTIGVLLVAAAFLFAAAPGFSGAAWITVLALAAAAFWILSEILVARLRAVLPGMALSILFAAFAAMTFVTAYYRQQFEITPSDVMSDLAFWRNPTLLVAAPALAASLVYYWRFRLPFALALIACFGYVTIKKLFEMAMGTTPSEALGFVFGLALLATALFYDSRDPKRQTRLADCAFWLHLVAAPFIVSPVITAVRAASSGTSTSLFVLATVLALGIFALAIDRRALLVSSLLYFTIAIYDIFSGGIDLPTKGSVMPSSFIMTLAFVGVFVLVLGVFWNPLRNLLVPMLRKTGVGAYIPPQRT